MHSKREIVRQLSRAMRKPVGKRELHDAEFGALLGLLTLSQNVVLSVNREFARRRHRFQMDLCRKREARYAKSQTRSKSDDGDE